MASPRYITPEGFRRLAEEHWDIWTVQRPRIVAEVEAAAALGDRSENAEYIYGKRKLRELDRRLRFLSERMDSLTVVEPRARPVRAGLLRRLGDGGAGGRRGPDLPPGRRRRVRRGARAALGRLAPGTGAARQAARGTW